MDIRYAPYFSLDETAAQIATLEEHIGVTQTPFLENETVADLQHAMQSRVAYAASELMTGMRMHGERQEYLEAYQVYRRLLGAVALDAARRTYKETGNVDTVKREVNSYLRTSKHEMVALDYERRLEKSPLERAKQKVAQSDRARFVVPFGLSTGIGTAGLLATAAFVKTAETPALSSIDLSPSQRGIATLAAVAIGLATRSALRSGSGRVGAIVRNQANISILTYMLDKLDGEEGVEAGEEVEHLIGRYAMRHLEAHSDKLGRSILDYDVKSEEDIAPMVQRALDVSEAATHKSYGVDPKNEWPGPWYLRMPSRVLRVNLASS